MDLREASEDSAARWIVRREHSDWSAADDAEFDEWLHASISNRVAYLRLSSVWKEGGRLKALGAGVPAGTLPPPELSRQLTHGESKTVPSCEPSAIAANETVVKTGRRQRRFMPALAAGLLMAVAVSASWVWWSRDSYRTEVGGLEQIAMADGSRAILNTDSRMRVSFSTQERRVRLTRGEAFFEVAKDASRPFSVEAGTQRITAVGTMFSVRYSGSDVQIVVTEGSVRVEHLSENGAARGAVKLAAGDIALAGSAGVLVNDTSLPDAEALLSWRSGFIVLHQVPLWEAANEFNRYNDRKLVVADPQIAGMRIGGTFRANNIDAFARLLHTAFGIQVELHDEEIVLSGR